MRTKAEVLSELRGMLSSLFAAKAAGQTYARLARAHGYVDGKDRGTMLAMPHDATGHLWALRGNGGYLATAWQRRTGVGYAWVLALCGISAVPSAFAAFALNDLAQAKVALAASMFFLFICTGPLNTLILETVPVRMRATAVAASIFMIHMFGDLWSPKVVGYISDRLGDLRLATLWALPATLLISAFFWCWLVVVTKRRLAAERS